MYLWGLGQSAIGVRPASAQDSWRLLMARKLEVSELMTKAVERNLVRHGIERIRGRARFLPGRRVEVEKLGGEVVTTRGRCCTARLGIETSSPARYSDGRPRRARLGEHPRNRRSAGVDPRHRRWFFRLRVRIDLRRARRAGDHRGRRQPPAPGARCRDGAGPRRVLQLHGDPRDPHGLSVRRCARRGRARGQARRRPHAPGAEDLDCCRPVPPNRGPGACGSRSRDRLQRLGPGGRPLRNHRSRSVCRRRRDRPSRSRVHGDGAGAGCGLPRLRLRVQEGDRSLPTELRILNSRGSLGRAHGGAGARIGDRSTKWAGPPLARTRRPRSPGSRTAS